MGSEKKKKAFTSGALRGCLTAGFIACSAASFGARYYLEKSQPVEASAEQVHVRAEFLDGSSAEFDSAQAGSAVKCERAVKITQGEGYVRFNIELLDSDGTPLDDKLKEKLAERANLESMADPSMASYQAFQEGIYWTYNDYNQLTAKGELLMNAFCRVSDEDVLELDHPVSISDIEELSSSGELEQGFESEDFLVISSEEEPFKRTVICTRKLTEGDVLPLYDHIVLPYDWQFANTEYDGYMMNEDGGMEECFISINNMELLGEGFGIRVSADVVDAADSMSAAAAFKTAQKAE